MKSPQTTHLTEGPVNRQILKLSLPTMVGMLLQSVYDLVDMVWIGFISPAAIASATLFGTFFWLIEVLNEIVGTSSVALISQSHGAADRERTTRISEQTLAFKFILACIGATILGLGLRPLFHFFSQDMAVISYGMDYGLIRVLFLPFFFSSYSVNTIFRCTGDAKTPMRLLVGSALLNMVADPLFMFDTIPGTSIRGLGMGMKGAAIATVMSISLSFMIGFGLLILGKGDVRIRVKNLFKLDPAISAKLFSIGLPSGLTLLLRNLSIVIFLKMVAMYGTEAVAVSGIAFRVYSFALMPGWGLTMGSGIIIGHSLGAKRVERAFEAVRLTTIDCLLFVGLLALPIIIFPSFVLSLFMGGTTVPGDGILLMRIVGLALFIGAGMSGMGAAFTGAGKNRPMLYASVLGQWGVLVPWALVATLLLKAPILWLWLAILAGDGAEMLSRWYLYKKTKWATTEV